LKRGAVGSPTKRGGGESAAEQPKVRNAGTKDRGPERARMGRHGSVAVISVWSLFEKQEEPTCREIVGQGRKNKLEIPSGGEAKYGHVPQKAGR